VYQLWFANIPSRNFFYTYFEPKSLEDSNNERKFARPYRILTNHGDNEFTMIYNNFEDNAVKIACDAVLLEALKENQSTSAELDLSGILDQPCFVYEYNFNMPGNLFNESFHRSGEITKITTFNYIALIPEQDTSTVWFLDETGGIMTGYKTKSKLPAIVPPPLDSLIYEASVLNDMTFTKNTFVAKRSEYDHAYSSISIVNPYVETEPLMDVIEKHVATFFENPASAHSNIGNENVYTYSDEYTVVKYYQNDVLDYVNYRTGVANTSTMRNFEIAVNFIEADTYVNNEYYLAGYEQGQNEITFYFDYVMNNLPILLPDEYKREGVTALRSAIEVTVREETVARYRKLVYNFLEDELYKSARLDFNEALQAVGGSWFNIEGNPLLTGVTLGYKIDRDKQAYLYWVLQTTGGSLSRVG
jgi:hypothetical protein